ncbi:Hsp20/alpha crystallin family protein [Roseospira goensis]|uniref:HSP20 family protein n=1 Tax=Roseospira goensis TaxID=391922 RepID=A0A7W6RZZ3_9PROT|nr:Hsp20/alpha crystallin family protein [Roseospira goensis]MBB4285729.1 HSP20 family protein [Roseospira goensis]
MRLHDIIPWAHKGRDGGREGASDHPMMALQRDMNRAFDDFWGALDRPFGPFGPGFGARAATDVVETDGGVEVTVELPGMEEKDIDLSVVGDSLVIKGEKKIEKKEEKTGYYVAERSYGSVYRSVPLPAGVDAAGIKAAFKNGVLTVTLPRSAEAKENTRKIPVEAA